MPRLVKNSLVWTWVGALLVMAGYWAPWVNHKSPSLVLIGFDLAEFVKFTTAYRSGTLAGVRETLWLPPAAAALLLSLAVGRTGKRKPLLARGFASATGLWMAFTLLPPFPYHLPVLFSPEFRGQTILALVGMIACAVAFVAGQLGFVARGPAWRIFAVGIALAGAVLPLWEFTRLKPLLNGLYGRPVTPGWGISLMIVGFLIAAWAVWPADDR